MLRITCLVFCAFSAIWAATPAEIEKRIDTLLARMTLEEKLGQMSQNAMTGLSNELKEELRRGRWGSLFNGGTLAEKTEAQRMARSGRTGIPLIFGQDVIHGYKTIVPIPLGQAASWNPELVRQASRIAAREASADGIHWTFAPMMDIARDPRWGRIAESLGEDPYLAGELAVAMVRGFQGDSLSAPDSIAACAKHYVGYGAAESGRDYNSTWIPENLLRDIYLEPFRVARDAGVQTFMSAFNSLNGIPASGNEFTLREVLRQEWKFDGFVVSDYTSIPEMIQHGFVANAKDAARKGIQSGVDMEMVSTSYYDSGRALVATKQIDPKLIDQAVRNILRVKLRLGLFDDRALPAAPSEAEARDVAKRLAAESLVLLKNEGNVLPLTAKSGLVAVIGPMADRPDDQVGTWAMNAAGQVVTPLAALRQQLGADRVVWIPGLRDTRDRTRSGFETALQAARSADVVLLFLGEEASLSGEAASRAYLDLPGAQEDLVNEVAKAEKPMIAIILAGRPLTFHNSAEKMKGVLWAWHPGTMGGAAIADALLGVTSPSGKLPVSFPRTVGQVPIYYNHLNTGRPPGDDKYTSKYIDIPVTPEYPFGFGLSYTQFTYANPKVSGVQVKAGGSFTLSADVTNTGARDADEIAQLYVRDLVASEARPVRELKGFRRLHLKAGEKQTVEFTVKTGDLAFYKGARRVTEPGLFQAWIGPDSTAGVQAQFEIVP
jgi:beta-glucosidase